MNVRRTYGVHQIVYDYSRMICPQRELKVNLKCLKVSPNPRHQTGFLLEEDVGQGGMGVREKGVVRGCV